MNTLAVKVEERSIVEAPAVAARFAAAPKHSPAIRWRALLALPAATLIALAVHIAISKNEPASQTVLFTRFLAGVLGVSLAAALVQKFWGGFRAWLNHMNPILAAAMLTLCGWEVITAGVRLLPLPFFPSPAGVLQSMLDDRKLLLECAAQSLFLLAMGYIIGVIVGLVTGVCIGWFRAARYWGMPFLKMVGPLPATAWVPLAMALSPSGRISAIGLVALAVWFPVTMLTISGIANTRSSYLDVARTLGAKPAYLIFRVAIPAAMPSIFIGLFMGLSTAFLTLIVAETVGVKSGLGWYAGWAQGWAEFGKVYAAMLIMAVFFSTIMTVLFKVRDRVLVWQKGVIKW